jgi:hypothetical protein
MNTVTKEEVKAGLSAVMAVGSAIRDLGSVPNGRLYAELMGQLSQESYNKVIDLLKRTGMVSEDNHVLTWTGPK